MELCWSKQFEVHRIIGKAAGGNKKYVGEINKQSENSEFSRTPEVLRTADKSAGGMPRFVGVVFCQWQLERYVNSRRLFVGVRNDLTAASSYCTVQCISCSFQPPLFSCFAASEIPVSCPRVELKYHGTLEFRHASCRSEQAANDICISILFC